jgi:hypothetical protein
MIFFITLSTSKNIQDKNIHGIYFIFPDLYGFKEIYFNFIKHSQHVRYHIFKYRVFHE